MFSFHPMLAVIAALSICVISAISRIFLKKGMDSSNPMTGMVFSLVIGWAALTLSCAALVPFSAYNLKGILFFAMIGIVAPPVVRYLTYLGIDTLGPARSDQLRSLTPFFAIFFAIFLFDEPASLFLFLGAVLIFVGVIMLVGSGPTLVGKSRHFKLMHLSFPVIAAIVAGAVANMRKLGGTLIESPLLAATAAATSGVLVFAAFLLITGKWRSLVVERRSSHYFILAGLCTGATDVLDLVALKHGRVSVVVPILASSPLFVLLFSRVFLGQRERVTLKLALSALLIFGGVETIVIFAK